MADLSVCLCEVAEWKYASESYVYGASDSANVTAWSYLFRFQKSTFSNVDRPALTNTCTHASTLHYLCNIYIPVSSALRDLISARGQ